MSINSEILKALTLSFLYHGRAIAAKQAKHQQEIMQVMCVLPGEHRYEQVEATINASGVWAHDIYESLAANQRTIALARFYESLNGPA